MNDKKEAQRKRLELERERVKNRLCRQCGGNLDSNDPKCTRCAPCRYKKRDEAKLRAEDRRKNGICDKCGINPSEERRFRCRKCLDYHRRRNLKVKDKVFQAYGGYKCACCGCDNKWFMQIDHIENNGEAHRRTITANGSGFYDWLVRNNYPSGFQVLCGNCNFAKGKYGSCPHTWADQNPELPPEVIRSGRTGKRKRKDRH